MADDVQAEIQPALEWWTSLDRQVEQWKHLGLILRGAVAAQRVTREAEQRLSALTEKLAAAALALEQQQEAEARHRATVTEQREVERRAWQHDQDEAQRCLVDLRGALDAAMTELERRRRDLHQLEQQIQRRDESLRAIEAQLREMAAQALRQEP